LQGQPQLSTWLKVNRLPIQYKHIRHSPRPASNGGEYLSIELSKTALHIFKIVAVELAEQRRHATMIDRARLMQTRGHVRPLISDANEPTPLFLLRRCRDDELKSMRELLVDDHRPREQCALAPLISDPTLSPTLAHQMSRSETSGGVCCLSYHFFLSPNHSENLFNIFG
jgi:hypothetical protein